MLSWCDRLYCPEKEDAFSAAKLTEYDSYLRVAGYEALVGRIQRIPLAGLSCGIAAAQLNQWQRFGADASCGAGILAEEAGGDE